MAESLFQRLYRGLNADQKKAVDAIEGPVMVIAGPGTGKTAVLTLRIANILKKTDVGPEVILALTFTENGAHEMRRRLVSIIGSEAYRLTISTFHGFANQIISEYAEFFPRLAGRTHITQVDQIHIFERLIKRTKLSLLRPYGNPFYYIPALVRTISDLKKDNISPKDLSLFIKKEKEELENDTDKFHTKGSKKGIPKAAFSKKEKDLAKTEELATLYQSYEEVLKKEGLYDYDDMVLELVRALKEHQNLLLDLEERYQYILADEHQDTNAAQNSVLELLSSFHDPAPNLFIVGDEKQAIFRFQGASLDNFIYFKKKYPQATVITLKENYRSGQKILDAAHSLMEKSPGDVGVRLLSRREKSNKPVRVFSFPRPEDELFFVAKEIKRALESGLVPSAMAVLYRDNQDAASIGRALARENIPFITRSEENLLEAMPILLYLRLARAVAFYGNDDYLVPALFIPSLGIGTLDRYRLFVYRKEVRLPLIEVLSEKKHLKRARIASPKPFLAFAEKLGHLHKEAESNSLLSVLEEILSASNILKNILSKEGEHENLTRFRRLFDEAEQVVRNHRNWGLKEFLNYLDTLSEYRLPLSFRGAAPLREGVTLSTAHRAKGLEFEHVYIVGAWDGHWGNRRSHTFFPLLPERKKDIEDGDGDERRLFYVALTRAKKESVITYAVESEEGKARLATRFISEIDPSLLSFKQGERPDHVLKATFREIKQTARKVPDKKFLQDLFLEEGLSVTALNNYLACPWQYFFVNLLRIPKAPTYYQYYGIAVHAALQKAALVAESGRALDPKQVLTFFEESLRKQPLSGADLVLLLEKGKRAIPGYVKARKEKFNQRGLAEFRVKILLGDIPLSGILDRIIFLEGNAVEVIDYKTRSPLSRNDILGLTKKGTGDYYRQLLFYKLLLNHYQKGRMRMELGTIDFVEPNKKGKYQYESFAVGEKEVQELERLVKKVADEIKNLSFWNVRCKRLACEYCALRESMGKK